MPGAGCASGGKPREEQALGTIPYFERGNGRSSWYTRVRCESLVRRAVCTIASAADREASGLGTKPVVYTSRDNKVRHSGAPRNG